MRFTYTYHAQDKFIREKYVFQLNITKSLVKSVVENPVFESKTYSPGKTVALGRIDENHTLVVIHKYAGRGIIKVITFYPINTGGTYESKILQGGRYTSN